MAGGEVRNAILDGLDSNMLQLFNEYKHLATGYWGTFVGNHGQLTIVRHHFKPITDEHVNIAKQAWPLNTSVYTYERELLECRGDMWMIYRAFSDSLQELGEKLDDLQNDAIDLQNEHDEILGSISVHSTNPPWTADNNTLTADTPTG